MTSAHTSPLTKARWERSPCTGAEPGTAPLPAGRGAGAPARTKAAPGDRTRGRDLLEAQLEGNGAAGSPRCSCEQQRLEAGGQTRRGSSHPLPAASGASVRPNRDSWSGLRVGLSAQQKFEIHTFGSHSENTRGLETGLRREGCSAPGEEGAEGSGRAGHSRSRVPPQERCVPAAALPPGAQGHAHTSPSCRPPAAVTSPCPHPSEAFSKSRGFPSCIAALPLARGTARSQ